MLNKLVMATNNANKLKEVKEILSPMGIEVLSQNEAGVNVNPEENGETFEQNSEIKARAVYNEVHMPVIADDSGICVDYLDGKPGVYSARYAPSGQECEKLLSELKGVPDEKRTARFVCVITMIDEKGEAVSVRGECEGKIGYEKLGTNGFGYDPIFMYGDKSFAEIEAAEKNKVSHRANALKLFSKMIKERYCD